MPPINTTCVQRLQRAPPANGTQLMTYLSAIQSDDYLADVQTDDSTESMEVSGASTPAAELGAVHLCWAAVRC